MPADDRKLIDIPATALCPHEVTMESGRAVTLDEHGAAKSDGDYHLMRIKGHCADLPYGGTITLVMDRGQLSGLIEACTEALGGEL